MDYHYHKNFCWRTFCFMTGINSLLNLLSGSQSCHTGFSSEVQHHPLYQATHSLRSKGNQDLINLGRVIDLHSTEILRARQTPSDILHTIPTSPNKNSELASSFSKLFEKVRPVENLSHHSKHFSVFNNSCSTDVNETVNGVQGRRGASWWHQKAGTPLGWDPVSEQNQSLSQERKECQLHGHCRYPASWGSWSFTLLLTHEGPTFTNYLRLEIPDVFQIQVKLLRATYSQSCCLRSSPDIRLSSK